MKLYVCVEKNSYPTGENSPIEDQVSPETVFQVWILQVFFFLFAHFFSYLPTFLPTYPLLFLLNCSSTYPLSFLLTYCSSYLRTFLPTHPLFFLPTHKSVTKLQWISNSLPYTPNRLKKNNSKSCGRGQGLARRAILWFVRSANMRVIYALPSLLQVCTEYESTYRNYFILVNLHDSAWLQNLVVVGIHVTLHSIYNTVRI